MKTIVITGSTRGLGLELAKCFRKKGLSAPFAVIFQTHPQSKD